MMTVNEVSKLSGVSIRTLQYYDTIKLLSPTDYTVAGYRLYDKAALERLQQILLFRELEFPLKDIKEMMERPNLDKKKILEQQITLLTMKKEHINNLIHLAQEIQLKGDNTMNFSAFDNSEMDIYKKQAKEQWGNTREYKEYEEKTKIRSKEVDKDINDGLMNLFVEFAALKTLEPSNEKSQEQVKKLQTYITENYYKCSNEILFGLGQMYVSGGEFTENIDKSSGIGTAEFVAKAIENFIKEK